MQVSFDLVSHDLRRRTVHHVELHRYQAGNALRQLFVLEAVSVGQTSCPLPILVCDLSSSQYPLAIAPSLCLQTVK